MKPRTVIVQLEILTDAKVKDLEDVFTSDEIAYQIMRSCGYQTRTFDITEKPKVNVVKK